MGKDGGLLAGARRASTDIESRTSGVRPRFSSVLMGSSTTRCFDSIVTLPSNIQAVESALLFAMGRLPFVAIVGPPGWGKTHLLEAAARAMVVVERDQKPQTVDGKEWLSVASKIDPLAPLLVDNAQEAFNQRRAVIQFRLALERRVKAGRPTLLALTGPKSARSLRLLLPNFNSWVTATIEPPTSLERVKLVGQIAQSEGLVISDSLQNILAKQLTGDGRTIEGAFKRLRLQDARWLDAASTLRALGVLNPFFADNSNWDLRDAIWTLASNRCRTSWNRELATYTMLRIALLCEADVAHYFETEPSAVYAQCAAFQKRMDQSDEIRQVSRKFAEEVVDSLSRS